MTYPALPAASLPQLKMHRIEVSPAAERDLYKLHERIRQEDFELITSLISTLASKPRPQGVRKIKGEANTYRIRAGHYRIIYDIYDRQKLVVLLNVSRRSETTYK